MSDRAAHSVLGLFDTAEGLLEAIPQVQGAVRARLEAYTPYPVEEVAKALGFRKSPIGGMVLVTGILGALSGLGFELWTSGVDYPLITAGKPYFSWEAFVPIMFEVTVLFATFTSAFGMLLLLNRLPAIRHPMLASASVKRISRDKFALAVEADGGALDAAEVTSLLRKAGAGSVEVVEEPAPAGPLPLGFLSAAFLAIALSCMAAGLLTYWATKLFPVSAPMVHMLEQPRVDPQRGPMRMPVPETVPRGSMPYLVREQDSAFLANPLPRTGPVFARGRQAFNNYCSVCHGILGDGAMSLTPAYGARPANLISGQVAGYPDGRIYHVITTGKNAMPSYAADLAPEERWSVVHYVRALERAMNAHDEDLK